MKKQTTQDLLLINIAMLFISTSGVLGRYVSLTPEITILWRAALAMILLWGLCRWQQIPLLRESNKHKIIFLLAGTLMAAHWVTYFYALQLSSVAIGMLSLFTYPIITAVLEPLLLGTKFHKIHLLLGILTLIGIYLLSPDLNMTDGSLQAIGFGTLSATCYALRNILMKASIEHHHGTKLMLYQATIASICLLPFLSFQDISSMMNLVLEEWWAILFLALFTTVIGHTLFLRSFKRFSVTTASILSCTQPVYGIILGILFLGEYPPWTTVIGGLLILIAVAVEGYQNEKVGSEP